VELAELSQHPDFRASVRRMAEHHVADRAEGSVTPGLRRDLAAAVRDQVGPALVAGIDPATSQADPIVAAVTAHYAHVSGPPRRRRPSASAVDPAGERERLSPQAQHSDLPRQCFGVRCGDLGKRDLSVHDLPDRVGRSSPRSRSVRTRSKSATASMS
jgi:hypothetical protein